MTLTPKDAQALADATARRGEAEKVVHTAVQKQYALIGRAVKNGASLREVAEIVGVSHQMVDKIVKRWG